MKKQKPTEDWHYCHECQLKRGGVVPKWGHRGITVMGGKCSMCGENATLVPNEDYHWPKKGIKAVID